MENNRSPKGREAGTGGQQHLLNVTPSPPLNEQSPSIVPHPQQQQQNSSILISGMRQVESCAEWQLQAVLYRAKLTQYFDTFISQGGDDIDQIMQSDEEEFLEIMALVGMASKPLHVRRLQRTLNEFSLNRAQFLINAVPFIGLPPIDFPSTSSSTDNLSAALQFLVPGYIPTSLDPTILPTSHHQQPQASGFLSASVASTSHSGVPSTPNTPDQNSTVPSATAFPLALPDPSSFLLSLVNNPFIPASSSSSLHHVQHLQMPQPSAAGCNKRIKLSFSPPATPAGSNISMAGEKDEEGKAGGIPTAADCLTEAEIARIRRYAQEMVAQLPAKLESRHGQSSRRRMEKGLLEAVNEAMELAPDDPRRIDLTRHFGRIYGRFDAKRKQDKALTRHELVVNESSCQLSLLRPELLARRDELFPLSRKLARLFELPDSYRPSDTDSFDPNPSKTTPSNNVGDGVANMAQKSGGNKSEPEDREGD